MRAVNIITGLTLLMLAVWNTFDAWWLLVAVIGIGMVGVDLYLDDRAQYRAYLHSLEEKKRHEGVSS